MVFAVKRNDTLTRTVDGGIAQKQFNTRDVRRTDHMLPGAEAVCSDPQQLDAAGTTVVPLKIKYGGVRQVGPKRNPIRYGILDILAAPHPDIHPDVHMVVIAWIKNEGIGLAIGNSCRSRPAAIAPFTCPAVIVPDSADGMPETGHMRHPSCRAAQRNEYRCPVGIGRVKNNGPDRK